MRFLLAALAVAGGALIIFVNGPRPALACSAGPDFDPIAESDAVVGGRIQGYELLPDTAPLMPEDPKTGRPMDPTQDAYAPVRVDMIVDRVFKGQPAPAIVIVDTRSIMPRHDRQGNTTGEFEWAGAGGACGAFDFDPTGLYTIMGLSANPDGTYTPNRLQTFYFGNEPLGPEYERALERMASFPGAASLPALGSGPPNGSHPAAALWFLGLAAAGVMLSLGGIALFRRGKA
jgi:hypothetical protein